MLQRNISLLWWELKFGASRGLDARLCRQYRARPAETRSFILAHRSDPVNDFARQTQEFFSAAKEARIPEQVQAIAEDSVTKARESYGKLNTVAKDSAKVLEEVMVAAQA